MLSSPSWSKWLLQRPVSPPIFLQPCPCGNAQGTEACRCNSAHRIRTLASRRGPIKGLSNLVAHSSHWPHVGRCKPHNPLLPPHGLLNQASQSRLLGVPIVSIQAATVPYGHFHVWRHNSRLCTSRGRCRLESLCWYWCLSLASSSSSSSSPSSVVTGDNGGDKFCGAPALSKRPDTRPDGRTRGIYEF